MSNEVHFADYDAQTIIDNAVARFESVLGVNLGDADERRIMLNAYLLGIIELYAAIDDAGRQNLLAYARSDNLDAIGDTRGVKRLAATPSTAVLTFKLSAAQSANVIIPAGTRVTPDGELFWATDKALVISAGDLSGNVTATCLDVGNKTNGFAAGALATLVDPIAYVASVSNTGVTVGGADVETDENYRERLRESRSIYSTAGSIESYSYYARSADVNVLDVYVSSPSAGNVSVAVLASAEGRNTDGSVKQAVLDAVLAKCGADYVRPLTDNVAVASATPVDYDVSVTYYVNASDESRVVDAIEGAGGALAQYYEWQSGALGRAINPDKLRSFLIQAGAQWAIVTNPSLTKLASDEYALLGAATIAHEVIST